MNKKLVLAVDFDNTIHDTKHPVKGMKMGPPLEGAKEALTRFKQRGDTVIIHSIWGHNNTVISDWLKYYGIPFDRITNLKPQADYYIDDKAIKFEGWDNITI